MFFYASKIGWIFLTPSNLIFAGLALGLLLSLIGRRRAGMGLSSLGLLMLALCGFGPGGAWLALPLEARFAQSSDTPAPAGIIVLGGAVKNRTPLGDRDMLEMNEAGERVTAMLLLARRYPQAKIVFTGGYGELLDYGPPEADEVRAHIGALGLDPARIIFEDKSRNTYENAVFSKNLIDPKPGERWLLVTSSWHMPRSIGCFRKAGFPVEAFPVDFRTDGRNDSTRIAGSLSGGLFLTDLAAHEWVGLLAYWLTGKTDTLFPAR